MQARGIQWVETGSDLVNTPQLHVPARRCTLRLANNAEFEPPALVNYPVEHHAGSSHTEAGTQPCNGVTKFNEHPGNAWRCDHPWL